MSKVSVGRFIPFPVVPITVVGVNVNGKANYLPVGFVSGVNVDPPVVCLGINKHHFSIQGFDENRTFSINIPIAEYIKEVDFCGLGSGKNLDKSAIFSTFYGDLETAPMIQDFPITCECELLEERIEFDMDIVLFGRVKQVFISDFLLLDDGKIDTRLCNLLCFAGLENKYCLVGDRVGNGWEIGKTIKNTK